MKNSLKILNRISLVFIVLLLANSVFAGAGDIDTSFGASAYGRLDGSVYKIVEQSDGKFVVGGSFTEADGNLRYAIARFNTDGTLDNSFSAPLFYSNDGPGNLIRAIAIQNDGKILVAGDILGYGTTSQPGVYRLKTDGSIDFTFTANIQTGIQDIEILPDNNVLVSGSQGIVKLDSGGNVITQVMSIGVIYEMEVLANGQIYLGSSGSTILRRMNADLSFDNSFTTVTADSGSMESIKVLPNGQVLVAGSFDSLNGFNIGGITRINSDGSLDLSFNLNNVGASSAITGLDVKSNGKIIISGHFIKYNGIERIRVAQLNSDGTLDVSFQLSETIVRIVSASLLTSNEDIILGINNFLYGLAGEQNPLIKVLANGTVENSFDARLNREGRVDIIKQTSDGKIYAGGQFRFANELETWSIARFNLDGSVDASFVSGFTNVGLTRVTAIEVQPDGKILVSSDSFSPGIRRLNSDGSFDPTFTPSVSSSDTTYDLALLGDGKFLTVGFRKLQRRNSDGTLDASFIPVEANDTFDSVTVQPNGKIIVAGYFTQIAGVSRGRIARFNADGTLDNTFNPPGGANGIILDVELQPDGKILVSGFFTALNGNNNQDKIGRLNADGTLDTSFAQSANAAITAMKLQSDGKILVGGIMSMVGAVQRIGFARLNSNGSLDPTLIADSPKGVLDIDIQSDNKILIGGEFVLVNNQPNVRVARLLDDTAVPNTSTDYDFDGDGAADIGVFRPSSNLWYQLLGPNYSFSQTSFGVSGDIAAPADFDGDGKTDIAIFRPSNGNWWYLSSVTNTPVNAQFGQNGDIPRPSDFDGDGKADLIVFRPSTSQWFRFGSTGMSSTDSFGISGDKPVVGDFDGDGKSDLAIYRPSTGAWWWQRSIDNGQRAIQWGIATDIPGPGDFDGDGITDFAIYRPSTGFWWIYNSATQDATIIQFGLAEDKPVPADYDGDGKVDIAVYRPSTGIWYLLQSTEGFAAYQFGISTDIPIPNALIP